MSFITFDFFVFFGTILLGTVIMEHFGKVRIKQYFLLAASYFFYGYWDYRFCFLLFFVTVVSYITAKMVNNKAAFICGITVPLVVLGIFKYFNFFLESASFLLGREIGALKIILPVGISFYTFQALSYVIDVKKEKIEVEHDFVRLALYISFFPQLVAGPIVKAADFLPQLAQKDIRVNLENIKCGIQIFVFGVLKKAVLADHLSVFVDDVYSKPAAFHWFTLILATVSYAFQIYFDFSGYSDMAIGCAKCFGYDFKKNFDMPYISQSVSEFWHRWHISLSTWLKEYLYIPLGGNRKGSVSRYRNLFLTMLLGGLWHGANWTFVFWGALNGLALCVDKIFVPKKKGMMLQMFRVLGTFIFICFTWIFFRAENFTIAWSLIKGIFSLQDGIVQMFSWTFVAFVGVFVCSMAAIIKSREKDMEKVNGYYPLVDLNSIFGLTVFFIAVGLAFGLAFTGENPFVYFQF